MFDIIKTKNAGGAAVGRVIFHVDVNSAFLSWEAVYRLYHLGGKVDLRTQVAAVGGDMAMRNHPGSEAKMPRSAPGSA